MISAITGILGEWGWEDADTKYAGDINARRALVMSRNGATVRLGSEVGLAKVQAFAKRAGIQSALKNENKTFLGSSEVTPAEMALGYSTFAGQGRRPNQLFLITKIKDPYRIGRDLHFESRRGRPGPSCRRVYRLPSA